MSLTMHVLRRLGFHGSHRLSPAKALRLSSNDDMTALSTHNIGVCSGMARVVPTWQCRSGRQSAKLLQHDWRLP